MNIDQILEEWSKDSDMDRNDLGEESLKIPKLHGKYYRMYVTEKMKWIGLKEDKKKLVLDKHDYYRGIMPVEEVKRRGWEIWNLTVLKSELPMYIDSDEHIRELNLKIMLLEEKCNLIESILKNIATRGYQIKTAVEFERFRAGN